LIINIYDFLKIQSFLLFNYPIILLPKTIKLKNIYSLKSLPPHNIIGLSHISSEFLNWFVGFTDAEGCFNIAKNLNKHIFRYTIT
jgi:hypothetical protein